MKCPHCGGEATYIGYSTIECGTPGCVNCPRKGPEAYALNNNIYVKGCTVETESKPLAACFEVFDGAIKEGDYLF